MNGFLECGCDVVASVALWRPLAVDVPYPLTDRSLPILPRLPFQVARIRHLHGAHSSFRWRAFVIHMARFRQTLNREYR